MKVIYSIGSKFGGHGIGGVARHAVRGIYRARALDKVLASYSGGRQKTEDGRRNGRVPKKYIKTMGLVGAGLRRLAYYDPTGWGYVVHDNIFDHWASTQLEPCDLFHGWNHHCLYQLQKVKRVKKGKTVTVVERASSHILQGQEILQEEYKKYGVRGSFWPKTYVKKCLKEYEETDYVVVPSDYAFQSFMDRGFSPEKLVKIPFGVDARKFEIRNPKSEIRNKSKILNPNFQNTDDVGRGKFVVLYVGDVRLRKGVQYLLEAWDRLNPSGSELWLVGEIKPDIRKVLSKYRNRGVVQPFGFRKDVPKLMGEASVFAFPSLDEGSALVTYEAMAAGLPVITTPNAGSLVRDSIDGYIIPIRDSEALAERLEFFYKYPEQARAMGESGRERIRDFTWEKYGETLVKAYIKMLKSG